MTERIHINTSYRTVGMIEVINEPIKRRVNATDADDMLLNFYPAAWDRIRGRESDLGIAKEDMLHIQYMVSNNSIYNHSGLLIRYVGKQLGIWPPRDVSQ
jgi:hypothetical protein